MANILLSIKPPYARLILKGKKVYELRKNTPNKPKKERITLYLYESGKKGKRLIIGKCEMSNMDHLTEDYPKNDLWMLEHYAEGACVLLQELKNYMPCYVWNLSNPLKVNNVSLSDIGLTRPPQSWQYLTEEQAEIIEDESELPF